MVRNVKRVWGSVPTKNWGRILQVFLRRLAPLGALGL
jgi:hypothetical protein